MKSVKSQENNSDFSAINSFKNKKSEKKTFKLLLILFVLGGGLGWWQILKASEQSVNHNSKQKPLSQPRPVETISLSEREDIMNIKLLGRVEASENFTVRTQVDGVVQRVLVREGDRVAPNQTIAFLDNLDQKIALSQAIANLAYEQGKLADLERGTRVETVAQKQAELTSAIAKEKEAKDNFQRTRILTQQGAISKRELIEAEANYESAFAEKLQKEATLLEAKTGPTKEEIEAQKGAVALAQAKLDEADLNLERTQIKSFTEGVVSSRNVSIGDYVEKNASIVNLINNKEVQIFLEIPENLSGKIKPGMTVELTARALPQWNKKVKITSVIPVANKSSRRQLVRIDLNNFPSVLLPGMAIDASLQLPIDSPTNANNINFVIPRDALVQKENRWIIFTISDNVAREIEVEIVADLGEKVVINHKNLKLGQSIVMRGGDGLQNNELVDSIEE